MSAVGKVLVITSVVVALQLSTGEADAEQDAEQTATVVFGTGLNVLQALAAGAGNVMGTLGGGEDPAPKPAPDNKPVTAADTNGDGKPG